MSKKTAAHIALLAPVPEEHLIDGAEVCSKEGKVAFGSRAFLVFVELDELRQGEPVDVYIYSSHRERSGPAQATWTARYQGFVKSVNGAHPEGSRYRPPSTFKYESDNKGHWGLFWEVTDLRQVHEDEVILVRDMRGWRHKTKYDRFFIPEGPLIIEQP